MGLAASQARLLTITSRLSNTELRQQQIANTKMRLANDQENVSTKYSNALNNQTLTLNDTPMTYADLVAAGYSVVRTSDGAYAGAEQKVSQPEQQSQPKLSAPVQPTQPASARPASAPAQPIMQKPVAPTAPAAARTYSNIDFTTLGSYINEASLYYADTNNSNSSGSGSFHSVASAIFNGNHDRQRNTLSDNIKNEIANLKSQAEAQGLTATVAALTNLQTSQAQNMHWLPVEQDPFSGLGMFGHSSSNSSSGIMGIGLNSMARLMNLASYNQFKTDYQNAINTNNNEVQTKNAEAQNNYNAQNAEYQTLKTQYDADKQAYDKSWETFNAQSAAWTEWNNYDAAMVQYQKDLEAYNNSQNNTSSQPVQLSQNTESNKSFEKMLNNSDFLIQGILSGYLTLMKDGKEVSLAGSKEISTVYDKTDDAQAEAEYKAEMAKINRKEKALDNEMKRLDTEHSALQTELESIKSIISDHASKDFNLFS